MSQAEYVCAQNAHRRHLSQEQRRRIVAELLRADPAKSDRAIGSMAKVDHKTVAAVRCQAEAVGEIPQQKTRTTSDGKVRPVKPTKPAGEPRLTAPPATVVAAPVAKSRPSARVEWKSTADRERAQKALGAGADALRQVAREIAFVKFTQITTARTKLLAAVAALDLMLEGAEAARLDDEARKLAYAARLAQMDEVQP
jgi:hypothetical protein